MYYNITDITISSESKIHLASIILV